MALAHLGLDPGTTNKEDYEKIIEAALIEKSKLLIIIVKLR